MKIHGNVKLKLKDAKTGRIQRIEEGENTFQSSVIADYLCSDGDCSNDLYANQSFRSTPWRYLVGGLLLFRDAIEVGSKIMPAGNVMTGKGAAGIVNNGIPAELGSWNDVLSNAGYDGEKFQITQYYDFTPSQANGKISCVSLTSNEGGLVGYGNANGIYPGSKPVLGKQLEIGYGSYDRGTFGVLAKDGNRYVISVRDSGIFDVTEYKASAVIGTVFAGLTKTYSFDMRAADIPSQYKNDHPVFHYCGDNIIRFVARSYSVDPNGTVYYGEFDCETKELEFKTFTNTSSKGIILATNYYDNKQANFTADGRIVAQYSSNGYIPIIFDLETGAVVYDGANDFNSANGDWGSNAFAQIGEKLYLFGGSVCKIVDLEEGTCKKIDAAGMDGGCACSYDEDIACYQTGGRYYSGYYSSLNYQTSRLIKLPFYLATIYNLPSSVFKDATMSMEVMYKLEEA